MSRVELWTRLLRSEARYIAKWVLWCDDDGAETEDQRGKNQQKSETR